MTSFVDRSGSRRFVGSSDVQRACSIAVDQNWSKSGGQTVVGFENHSGATFLGSGVRPIGKVLSGYGNNGKDGMEGARYNNVFCTYSHGCLLPKNPVLADHILKTALSRKYGSADLAPLDDAIETAAHDYMAKRLSANA